MRFGWNLLKSLLAAGLVLVLLTPSLPVSGQEDLPAQAYISGVIGHAQSYTLSCEARSASDWAAFWGVTAYEADILSALPRSDNPDEGFVGDPNDAWGNIPPASYGVHSAPIARVLRSYGLDAHKAKGLSWDDLRAEIASGRPVIVWIIGQMWNGTPRTYTASDGKETIVARYEHTMILIGYTEDTVSVVDGYSGLTQTYPLSSFLTSWSILGNQAVLGNGNPDGEPAPVDSPTEAINGLSYTVQRGDFLSEVASRYGLNWMDVAQANHITYPYMLYTGQVIILPGIATPLPENTATPEPTATATPPGWDLITPQAPDPTLTSLPTLTATPSVTLPPVQSATPAGTPLNTPAVLTGGRYVVQKGDYLVLLAQRYGLDWQDLAVLNHIPYPWILTPGATIQLYP